MQITPADIFWIGLAVLIVLGLQQAWDHRAAWLPWAGAFLRGLQGRYLEGPGLRAPKELEQALQARRPAQVYDRVSVDWYEEKIAARDREITRLLDIIKDQRQKIEQTSKQTKQTNAIEPVSRVQMGVGRAQVDRTRAAAVALLVYLGWSTTEIRVVIKGDTTAIGLEIADARAIGTGEHAGEPAQSGPVEVLHPAADPNSWESPAAGRLVRKDGT